MHKGNGHDQGMPKVRCVRHMNLRIDNGKRNKIASLNLRECIRECAGVTGSIGLHQNGGVRNDVLYI